MNNNETELQTTIKEIAGIVKTTFIVVCVITVSSTICGTVLQIKLLK